MSNGRIVADGHKKEVLHEKTLSRLFGIKVQLAHHGGYYHTW